MNKDIANDTLGANIKRLRKERGVTQEELAKAAFRFCGYTVKGE